MKRILLIALVAGLAIMGRQAVGGDSGDAADKNQRKECDRPALLETAADAVGQLKKDLDRQVPATGADQAKLLKLAAELAELAGQDKDAKHLRDEAEKDHPPVDAVELINRRQSQIDTLQKQLDGLRRLTRTEQQILVRVTLLEFSRAKLKAAGIEFPPMSQKTDRAKTPSGITSSDTSIHTRSLGALDTDPEKLNAMIDDLRGKNLIKVLAEPALITVSGRQAYFHSGGEIPYVHRQGEGDPAIEFKQFGTGFNFLPTALGNDRIRIEVHGTFTKIDNEQSVVIGGLKVPGLRGHECKAVVELNAGQTCIVGGIVSPRQPETAENALGREDAEKPDLGHESSNETELVMLVTPSFEKLDNTAHARKSLERSGYYGGSATGKTLEVPAPHRK